MLLQGRGEASSNQSSLCKAYWYKDTIMSFGEGSKFWKPLLRKRFIRAISCSKAHTLSAESLMHNSGCVTASPQITWTNHVRVPQRGTTFTCQEFKLRMFFLTEECTQQKKKRWDSRDEGSDHKSCDVHQHWSSQSSGIAGEEDPQRNLTRGDHNLIPVCVS